MQPLIHVCDLSELLKTYPGEIEIWAVDIIRQQLYRVQADHPVHSTPVSSSRFGCGNIPVSLKTPLGPHRICEVIGSGAVTGQPFKDRCPTGAPLTTWTGGPGDAILTRILWLEGLIPTLNGNSKSRYIYLHGTHQEEKLGQPASQGCIRMGNKQIARWADELGNQRPLVWIGHIEKGP